MAEDYELCTFQKHHKQKILLFLSSMRSYADTLRKNKYKIEYKEIKDKDFKNSYFDKLSKTIKEKKINKVSSFEVEDKFFEEKLKKFFVKSNIKWDLIQTPMFLNSRKEF